MVMNKFLSTLVPCCRSRQYENKTCWFLVGAKFGLAFCRFFRYDARTGSSVFELKLETVYLLIVLLKNNLGKSELRCSYEVCSRLIRESSSTNRFKLKLNSKFIKLDTLVCFPSLKT